MSVVAEYRPIKPCLQYVGSKVRMAARIVALLGEHGAYVEPFLGSAAVLLAKPPVPIELVGDLSDELVNFYSVLRAQGTRYKLIDALTFTPYARRELEIARGQHDPPGAPLDPVERARRFMVRTNQEYLGSNGGSWTSTIRPSSGHSNATKWNNYRTRLHEVSERLQNVQIECVPAEELLTERKPLSALLAKRLLGRAVSAEDPRVAVYLDPPYLPETRNGSWFSEDMTEADHRQMLDVAVLLPGPTVISAYPDSLYDELLVPAGWTGYLLARHASSASGRGSVAKRTEVLWASPACAPMPVEPVAAEVAEPVAVGPEGG